MAPLILHHKDTEPVLSVPTWFLTEYMPEANGDFVKVYLFLLMTATRSEASLSVAAIADELFCTESDVIRALKYWNRKGLLRVTCGADGIPCELSFVSPARSHSAAAPAPASDQKPASSVPAPAPVPDKTAAAAAPPLTPPAASVYPPDPDFQTLLLVSEKYLARTLKPAEVEMFAAWYRDTGKNFDLIDYLVQYCVGKGVPSLAYMNKVLLNWQNEGISTVREAKEYSRIQFEDGRTFLKAFGILNRSLTPEEAEKLDYWKNNLGFPMEMILEAARRTMNRTHELSLDYLEGILKGWNEQNVRTLSDVKQADAAHEAARSGAPAARARTRSSSAKSGAPNRFHNFEQRSYDYQEWEQELLAPYKQDAGPAPADDDWDQLLAPYRKNQS